MDAVEGLFNGFTDGTTWNGWECPYFEYLEAERVLRASEKNGFIWAYDEAEDVFMVRSKLDASDEAAYEVGAEIINVDGQELMEK